MMEKPKIINIQLLRFIAASLVLFFHGAGAYQQMGGTNPLLLSFEYYGFAGVDVFFVISGFIICYTNKNTAGLHNNLDFLFNRYARIFLGYWPFFFIMIAGSWLVAPHLLEAASLTESFFLIPDKKDEGLIGVSWTLSFELYFYTLFFILLFLPQRYLWLAVISLLVFVFNLYANYALDAYSWKGFWNLSRFERFFTSPWLLEFFMGCFVAWLEQKDVRRFAWTALIAGIVLFMFAGWLNANLLDGKIAKFFNYHLRMPLFGGASACIIYGLVNLEKNGLALFTRASLLLGGASYCIYLAHFICFKLSRHAGLFDHIREQGLNPALCYAGFILAIYSFCILFYLWFEKPIYESIKR